MSVVIPFPRAEPAGGCTAPVPGRGGRVLPLVPLHHAVTAWRRRHRSLVVAAGRWALARGLPMPADHIALWAAAAEQAGCYGDVGGLTGPWFAAELDWFVGTTVGDWCTAAGCPVPPDLPESLWYLYGFLADAGRLHPASDPLTDLRAALALAAQLRYIAAPPSPTTPGPVAA